MFQIGEGVSIVVVPVIKSTDRGGWLQAIGALQILHDQQTAALKTAYDHTSIMLRHEY